MSAPPNANEECVGPSSEQAGKASACDGCPNQSACASGEAKKNPEIDSSVTNNMLKVKHRLLVLSGKGGVGKSTFSAQLAFGLAQRGCKVGLLDVDVCGPSIPTMMGLRGREVHQSNSGWSPVYVDVPHPEGELGVMSIGFLMPDQDAAVIWRGPRKSGLLTQFFGSVDWGELDFLVVDTPPGTSDEHISIVQMLKPTLGSLDGAVVVTTPQEVAMADVRKELNFCKQTGIRVLGVVENMAPMQLPLATGQSIRFYNDQQQDVSNLVEQTLKQAGLWDKISFGVDVFPSAGEGPRGMASKFNVPFLGSVPLDRELQRACDAGKPFMLSAAATGKSLARSQIDLVIDQVVQSVHPGLWEEKAKQKSNDDTTGGVVSVKNGKVLNMGVKS
ncbi:hypothetical protein BASA81_012700 [Batrachochytrium salamandrivorans]|nr:hypothetical protein BASA81_012700 [Batrachochytrium salamandrivorans]